MTDEEYFEHRDKIAHDMFGHKFEALSSWGKLAVSAAIYSEAEGETEAPVSLQDDSLNYKIASLQDQLAQAKKENHDLWEENESLKLLIEDQRGTDIN